MNAGISFKISDNTNIKKLSLLIFDKTFSITYVLFLVSLFVCIFSVACSSTEDEMEDANQKSATQVNEPPARDADADAMNDQEGHNEMENNSQDHATQVYEPSSQDTSDEEMDMDNFECKDALEGDLGTPLNSMFGFFLWGRGALGAPFGVFAG